ncbi:MAG: hypothetical protein WCF05_05945 [Chromatiaceae bacterium]
MATNNEAHKARRRGGLGAQKQEANNLLDFMMRVAHRIDPRQGHRLGRLLLAT